jgi:hypothetical protein
MPQLVRGGKWVFGWTVVGPRRGLVVPPAAWDEYGFRVGDQVAFVPGSQRSGGFGLSHGRLLTEAPAPLRARALAAARIVETGRVTVPPAVDAHPGEVLLVVRGSGRALGFIARGPIYREATGHPELACYGGDRPHG